MPSGHKISHEVRDRLHVLINQRLPIKVIAERLAVSKNLVTKEVRKVFPECKNWKEFSKWNLVNVYRELQGRRKTLDKE